MMDRWKAVDSLRSKGVTYFNDPNYMDLMNKEVRTIQSEETKALKNRAVETYEAFVNAEKELHLAEEELTREEEKEMILTWKLAGAKVAVIEAENRSTRVTESVNLRD